MWYQCQRVCICVGRWVSVWIIDVMRIVLCCCKVSVTHCCQQPWIKTDANPTTSSRVSPSAVLYTHESDRDTEATASKRDWTLSDIKITALSPLSDWLCALVHRDLMYTLFQLTTATYVCTIQREWMHVWGGVCVWCSCEGFPHSSISQRTSVFFTFFLNAESSGVSSQIKVFSELIILRET